MSTGTELGDLVSGWIDNRVETAVMPLEAQIGVLQAQISDANSKLSAALESARQASLNDSADAKLIADLRAALAAASKSPHYLNGWGEPSFLDEFDGTALDPAKWRVYDDYQLSYDMATVMAENVVVDGGKLHMLTKRRAYRNRPWTSSYITTGRLATTDAEKAKPDLFAQKYGRFEVRALIPIKAGVSAGQWSAPLWMRSRNTSGEIDIFESWGSPQNGPTSQRYRTGSGQFAIHQDTNHAPGTTKKTGWVTPSDNNPDLSLDFHTYGVEWTPSGFRMLFDGKAVQYGTYTNTGLGFPVSVFDDQFHLRVQMQVGQKDYWGVPDANTADADMVIDWVRAYPYKDQTLTTPLA